MEAAYAPAVPATVRGIRTICTLLTRWKYRLPIYTVYSCVNVINDQYCFNCLTCPVPYHTSTNMMY
jgi:hypothetical protein